MSLRTSLRVGAWVLTGSLGVAAPLACSGSDAGDSSASTSNPSAQSVHAEIFQGSCALSSSCHDSKGKQGRLDLSSVDSMCASLKNVPACERPAMKRVAVGQPEESFLYRKLTCAGIDCTSSLGAVDPSCTDVLSNARMPLNGAPLAPEKVQSIERWIREGLPGCP